MMKKDYYFGKTVKNNSLILLDKFNKEKYKNSNMCIFGSSGSGKSYFCKLNILREFLNGTYQYIIDPEREYTNICSFLNGTMVKIGPSSTNYINIFDIKESDTNKNYLESKLVKLKSFFYLVFENIQDEEYGLIEEKIISMYKKYGITFEDTSLYKEETINGRIHKKFKPLEEMPILEDLYNEIKGTKKLEKYKNRLKTFTTGSLKFFNNRTNVNLDNMLVIADIYDLGEENYKYGMFLFIEVFENKVKENKKKRKLIYIDEIWRIIGATSNKETATFIYKIFKTIRKNNGGAVAITQDIQDIFSLENGTYGKSIINNTSIKCIFSLEEENIRVLSENINLSQLERVEISNLDKGEMLLIAEYNRIITKVIANSLENEIIEKGVSFESINGSK